MPPRHAFSLITVKWKYKNPAGINYRKSMHKSVTGGKQQRIFSELKKFPNGTSVNMRIPSLTAAAVEVVGNLERYYTAFS